MSETELRDRLVAIMDGLAKVDVSLALRVGTPGFAPPWQRQITVTEVDGTPAAQMRLCGDNNSRRYLAFSSNQGFQYAPQGSLQLGGNVGMWLTNGTVEWFYATSPGLCCSGWDALTTGNPGTIIVVEEIATPGG